MDITCISDLHGCRPTLPGGDLLLLAGDYTVHDTIHEWADFFRWVRNQSYRKKVLIAGNHDNGLAERYQHDRGKRIDISELDEFLKDLNVGLEDFEYLCDSGTEFEGMKIWGSPWTRTFQDINPRCKAFTLPDEHALIEKWMMIPSDTDILLTHTPAWGMQDWILQREHESGACGKTHLGSPSLTRWICHHSDTLKLHVCGHIHEGYGVYDVRDSLKANGVSVPIFVNASHVNERYVPVNKYINIKL